MRCLGRGSVHPRGRIQGWEELHVPLVVVPVLRCVLWIRMVGISLGVGLGGVSGGQILSRHGGCVPGGRSGRWWQHQEHQ